MTCPNCAADVTAEALVIDGRLGTCQTCARSLVLDAGELRFGTSADLEGLSDAEITKLRKSRPSNWRQAQLATKARIAAAKG